MPDDPLSRRIASLRGRGGRSRSGTVKGLREDYNDTGMVRLDLEGERKPQKGGKHGGPLSIADTFDAVIPKKEAAGLQIGDRVTVRTFVEKGGGDAAD